MVRFNESSYDSLWIVKYLCHLTCSANKPDPTLLGLELYYVSGLIQFYTQSARKLT